MKQLFIFSKKLPVHGLDIGCLNTKMRLFVLMFVFICVTLNIMCFHEKLFFSDLRKMTFFGVFQKNREIFLHEIFCDGSLSLYEDSMPLTKNLVFAFSLFGHVWAYPNSEIYVLYKWRNALCGEDFHDFWLRAPNLEPFLLIYIYILTLLLLSTY